MNFFKFAFPVAIAMALLFAGCSDLNTQFSTAIQSSGIKKAVNLQHPPAAQPAVTIVSLNKHDSMLKQILAAEKGKTSKHKFKGLDNSRPFVACIWLSETGTPKPVFYVPVKDYDTFLVSLGKKYQLHQAIASKFRVGRSQFVVMQGDGHAKITPSLEAATSSRNSPGNPLDGLPAEQDFVFKWNPNSVAKKHSSKILKTIRHYLGEGFVPILNLESSLVFNFNAGNDAKNEINVHLENAPQHLEEIRSQMEDAFAVKNWSAEQGLVFSINDSAENPNGDISSHLQSAASRLFRAHLTGLAKRRRAGASVRGDSGDRLSSLADISRGLLTAEERESIGANSTGPAKTHAKCKTKTGRR